MYPELSVLREKCLARIENSSKWHLSLHALIWLSQKVIDYLIVQFSFKVGLEYCSEGITSPSFLSNSVNFKLRKWGGRERDGTQRSHMAPMRNPIPGQSNIRDSHTTINFQSLEITTQSSIGGKYNSVGMVPLRYKLFPLSVSFHATPRLPFLFYRSV